MKRIAIIGLPGSGKSTFAIQLGKILHLPVHHLDRHCFSNGMKRNQQEFIDIQQGLVDQDMWIIEGCSITTLDMRFARSDTVIYLNFSPLSCSLRVLKRALKGDQIISESGCAENVNWTLLKYIWNFRKEKGPRIEELKKRHALDFLEFSTPKQADSFLCKLKQNA
jgi:adenylate kinase family enzyme